MTCSPSTLAKRPLDQDELVRKCKSDLAAKVLRNYLLRGRKRWREGRKKREERAA